MNAFGHPQKGDPSPLSLRFFLSVLGRIERGTLAVELTDGRQYRSAGGEPGPDGRLTVIHPRFFRRLLHEGDLGFGEMFVDGWWTTPDLQALLDVVLLNNENVARAFPGARAFRFWQRLRRRRHANSRRGSPRNIGHHYDLGNAFYELWLDETMTYSSALFRSGNETLGEAQRRKYAAICDRLALAPGDRVLEIGCGWGGFAEYAVRERGAQVTGLTLSRAQHDYARRRLFEAGLAEQADIQLRDYRDDRGIYDRIVSIEMIEAVGESYWPAYFSVLRDRLRPGGAAGLQAITIADHLFPRYRKGTDFIQKHVFPGGLLPSRAVLHRQATAAGLAVTATETFGASYSRTLRTWRRRFNARWDRIAALGFDQRFGRLWNFYLAASAAGFAAGTTNVIQTTLQRKA